MGDFTKMLDSYFTPKGVLHEVAAGQPSIRFYPISPGLLFQLRSVARPIALALAVLFQDKDRDGGRVLRSFRDPKTGEEGTETVLEPVSVEMAKFRSDEREVAIDRLLDAVADEKTRIILARIVWDSAREDFDRGPGIPSAEQLKQLVDSPAMTIEAWGALLKGVAKANAGILGPLGEKLVAKATAAVEGLSVGSTAVKASASPTDASVPQSPSAES